MQNAPIEETEETVVKNDSYPVLMERPVRKETRVLMSKLRILLDSSTLNAHALLNVMHVESNVLFFKEFKRSIFIAPVRPFLDLQDRRTILRNIKYLQSGNTNSETVAAHLLLWNKDNKKSQ